MIVHLVVSGRSYHLASQLPHQLELPEGATVEEALARLRELLPKEGLPDSCLIALGADHLGTVGQHTPAALADGDELVLIAPVAGG